MAYIGVSPSNGVRQKHTYTATASQTTFSGAGSEGISLSYRDSNYVDVYVNGVKLGDADYTATSGTSIVLGVGAAVNDIVEIITYDVFSVADTVSKADGGTFDGNVTMAGTLDVTGDLTVDTSTLYVDSTNNRVGIGATSLSNKLTVNGDQVLLANGELKFADATNNQVGTIRNSGSSATSQLEFLTASTERMRIDASGNLLVGTTSQIQGGKLSVLGDIGFGTSTSKNLIGDFGTSDLYMINYNSGTMRFHVGGGATGDEAMRIDSSRNLLVGTTDSSVWDRNANSTADNGGNIRNDGRAGFSYYNASGTNATLNINRTGTDGILAEFRKSGTAVGSIGVNTKLYIGGSGETHTTGVSFQGSGTSTNRNISPSDGGGTLVDGAVNLGSSSARWNSLWLSGGVYLGGTGSANHLDDYEEGSFTVTLQGGTTSGAFSYPNRIAYYVKVGNLVTVTVEIEANVSSPTPTGRLEVAGLPFTCNRVATGNFQCNDMGLSYDTNVAQYTAVIQSGTAVIHFRGTKDNGSNYSNLQAQSMGFLRTTITYEAQ